MSKLSPQDEEKLSFFIKDWLKVHGFTQKDLANELKIPSIRTTEIMKKVREFYKKGGMFNVAKNLIRIEQSLLKYNQTFKEKNTNKEPYNQLDINYDLDIDSLVQKMEKDYSN